MLVLIGLCSMCASAAANSPPAARPAPPAKLSRGVKVFLFLLFAAVLVYIYLAPYSDDLPPPQPGSWQAKLAPPWAKRSSDDSRSKSAMDSSPVAVSDTPREIYVAPPTPAPQYRYVLKSPVSVSVPYGAMTVPAKTEVRVLRQTANAYRVQSGNLEFDVRADQLLSIPQ